MQNELIRIEIMVRLDEELDENDKVLIKNIVVDILSKTFESKGKYVSKCNETEELVSQLETKTMAVFPVVKIKDNVRILLTSTCFSASKYETFSLPSGIYRSLQLQLGRQSTGLCYRIEFPFVCAQKGGRERNWNVDRFLRMRYTMDSVRFVLLELIGSLENYFKIQ